VQRLARDAHPRVRLEAIRALAQLPSARSAELALDTYLPPEPTGANVGRTSSLPSSRATAKAGSSKDTPNPPPSPGQTESPPHISDPFLDYAAWLSINELAKPWTEAIASGAWKIEGREKQLVWGLTAIDPALAGQTLSRLGDKITFPKEGGPWIEIIGKAGGPKELRKLFAMVTTRDHFNASATVRALDALAEAARVRGTRPEPAPQTSREPLLNPDYQTIARLLASSDPELQGAAARLAGFWKLEQAADALAPLAASADAALRASAFGALREIGGQTALSFLGTLIRPDQPLDVRRAALVTIAQIKLDGAIFYAPDVLGAIRDENAALETWRALLQVKGAANSFAIKIKQAGAGVFPKSVATAGLRAAREIGKNGEALVAALAVITGGTTIAGPVTQDFQAMVDVTKRDGDPARGELIYRRANLGCVTCHAIGGAGGKVGPELTSLGASAPLDYIIESVLAPAAKVKEGFNGVTYTLNDGSVISGIQARETGQEIFVRDVTGREQSIVKTNIAGKQNIGSIMPAGLVEQLPRREQLDLFAFLGELGKPGVYDASKGQVARVWTLYPGADGDRGLRGELKSENSANAFTLVDGRLLKEQLVDAIQLLTNAGDVIYAVAQFQTAAAGKTHLNLSGATQAWLDGKPVVIEPTLIPELAAGSHLVAVKLDAKRLPDALRAETADGRFIGN
jgi:putative heme-binding domain-containing protein